MLKVYIQTDEKLIWETHRFENVRQDLASADGD